MVLKSIHDILNLPKTVITYIDEDQIKYSFEIDAVPTMTHSKSSSLTSFPVESGYDITDHVFLNPETIQFNGIISDYPLSLLSIANPFPYARQDKASLKAYTIFKNIYENKLVLNITTDLEEYTNMYIESMTFPRSAQTQNVLNFDITMKKLIIVDSELTTIPDEKIKPEKKDKVVNKKPKGTVYVKPVDNAPQSIWSRISDRLAGVN